MRTLKSPRLQVWGVSVRPDNDANERIYGEKISAKDIVIAHETHVPSGGRPYRNA